MPVKIRQMRGGDKNALMGIIKITPEFKPHEVVVAEEVIDAYLEDPVRSGYNILVAVEDSEVLGYICFGPTPCTIGTWDVYWVAVDLSKRGRGIGVALTEAAEKAMVKGGARQAIIETSSTPLYENTRRFHSARGYETVARVADFYCPGDDRLIMVKRLKR